MATKKKKTVIPQSNKSKRLQAKPLGPLGTAIDRTNIADRYQQESVRYRSLLEEVAFILRSRLDQTEIKLHSIEHRLKTLESLLGKCEREACNSPFLSFSDIAGARVICLFKDDLEQIGSVIRDNFEVIAVDDKRLGGNAPLGYLSIHYTCKIPRRYKGPRYDQTRDLKFEIQVRTLCMHCWAAVSHYIDYKGDWDIPQQHKMALSALAGLFYVADNEFQQFYVARLASRDELRGNTSISTVLSDEVNLDTVGVYLAKKFPDRDTPTDEAVSQFVQELKASDISAIAQLDKLIDRATPAMEKFEADSPPIEDEESDDEKSDDDEDIFTRYNQIGAARVCLGFVSSKFRRIAGPNLAITNDKSYTSLVRVLRP
jgi:ppGpp synthetase/RelA/SpoT-type nucleotidyltranferase